MTTAFGIPGMGAVLDQAFACIFHSAESQAEEVERRAADIEQEIYAALQTNERDAFDVFNQVPGALVTDKAITLGRAVLRNDAATVMLILRETIDEQVKEVALGRAEKLVRELTPDQL